jgi:hypothetical protein
MHIDLNRRHFVLGSAAALAQFGIAPNVFAQAPKISVPTVDSLTIRVLTDSSYDTPRVGGNKWVKTRRVPFTSPTDFRKTLHNEWGLSLALESRIGGDSRNLLLDFGYTANALMNNMEIIGVDGAKMQGLIVSHGHYDHFGGLLGFLEKYRDRLPADLALYVGGEDTFCARKAQRGPGPLARLGEIPAADRHLRATDRDPGPRLHHRKHRAPQLRARAAEHAGRVLQEQRRGLRYSVGQRQSAGQGSA